MRNLTRGSAIVVLAGLLIGVGGAAADEPRSSLPLLHWMTGSWAASIDGVEMEEHWTTPRAGMMLGLHRDVFASGKGFFEFLRIEDGPEGPVYLASPMGREATPFRMIEIGDRRAVFANPENDFPDRITYWMKDGGTLCARAEGQEGDEPRSSEWCWKRAQLDGGRVESAPPDDGDAD